MRPIQSRRDLLAFPPSEAAAPARMVHIASMLVQLIPTARDAVAMAVAALPGAELHQTAHPNKMAVVLESADERVIGAAVEALSQTPGVLTVSIVAHLTELESALAQETEA